MKGGGGGVRALVVGAGAVGLYYGAKLAVGGGEVAFWVRRGWEELEGCGVRVVSGGREEEVRGVRWVRTVEDAGEVDWVLVATKAMANREVAEMLRGRVGDGVRVLLMQNGLGNEEEMMGYLPGVRVAGGLCFVCLQREGVGRVRHFGYGRLELGEVGGGPTRELEGLAETWRKGGVAVECVESLAVARWRKLVWNVPFNGLTVVMGGVGVDRVLGSKEGMRRCLALMEEVRAVARAYGVEIGREFLERQVEETRLMGGYRPSTLVDWEAGRAIELEAIWERPLEAARRAGVQVPELERLVGELRAMVAGRG